MCAHTRVCVRACEVPGRGCFPHALTCAKCPTTRFLVCHLQLRWSNPSRRTPSRTCSLLGGRRFRARCTRHLWQRSGNRRRPPCPQLGPRRCMNRRSGETSRGCKLRTPCHGRTLTLPRCSRFVGNPCTYTGPLYHTSYCSRRKVPPYSGSPLARPRYSYTGAPRRRAG